MRIISGKFKQKKIAFNVADPMLRPTLDRIRETLFNWLASCLPKSNCLDLFAGSGIFGFEAISRGANFVTAVDHDDINCKHILANKLLLHLPDSTLQVIRQDAIAFLKNFYTKELSGYKFDIVFVDPPYGSKNLLLESLRLLAYSTFIPNNAKIYVECGHNNISKLIDFPPELKLIKASKTSNIDFYLLEKHNYAN